jgi:4-aminobutyrate aminotransferase-like enzyme
VDNARKQGETILAALRDLQRATPLIGDVRGRGLMIGVELVKDRATKEPAAAEAMAVTEAMRERGVLIGRGGRWGSVLRIQPPLVFGDAETAEMLAAFEASVAEVSRAQR